MLKTQRELDIRLGCSWQVVVGEMYSFSIDFEQVDHLSSPPYIIWQFDLTLFSKMIWTDSTALASTYSRALCPISSMGPSLSSYGSADSSFSKRQSKRGCLERGDVKVLSDQVPVNSGFDERRRKEVKRRRGKYVLGSFRDVTFSSSVCC